MYLNTLVLLASSVTLEISRRKVARFMGGPRTSGLNPSLWLYATLLLGGVFVAGQYAAWLQLRSEGFYLATNPNSSFFYLLTAIHALPVLGGLAGLASPPTIYPLFTPPPPPPHTLLLHLPFIGSF